MGTGRNGGSRGGGKEGKLSTDTRTNPKPALPAASQDGASGSPGRWGAGTESLLHAVAPQHSLPAPLCAVNTAPVQASLPRAEEPVTNRLCLRRQTPH